MSNKDKLKLIFSTLFLRKMTYAIFSTSYDDGTFMFTNISLDDAIIYEPSSEQYIHLIMLKDMEFVKWLYAIYPVLRQDCILDIRKFLSVINKLNKEDYGVLLLDGTTLVMTGADKSEECGMLIGDDMTKTYRNIFNGYDFQIPWTKLSDESVTKQDINDTFKKDICMMEIVINDEDNLINTNSSLFRIYSAQGKDHPCVQEYNKKAKEDCSIKILTQKNGDTVRVKYAFFSNILDIESICPAMFWFPRNISIANNNKKESTNG